MWCEKSSFESSEFSVDPDEFLNEIQLPTPMSIIGQPSNNKILDPNFQHTHQSYLSKESGDDSKLHQPASTVELQLDNEMCVPITSDKSGIAGGKFNENANLGKSNICYDVLQKPYTKDAIQSYLTLIPLINTISTANYCELLVETMRHCSPEIPLGDFYNLITDDFMLHQHLLDPEGKSNNQEFIFKKEGLTLCYYVLETFRNPSIPVGEFSIGLVDYSNLLKINFEQVRRVFLAIKIIVDSLVKVNNPSNISDSISRKTIMEGYTFICDRLLELYPKKSKFPFNSKNLKLGSSCFGRILRIVYPDLTIRRLGKRGSSRYHYMGLVWKNPLFEMNHFPLLDTRNPSSQTHHDAKHHLASEKIKVQRASDVILQAGPSTYKGYFFNSINPLSKYPQINCLPRLWEFLPGQIPQKSKWANEMIYQSVVSLKKINLDVEWLIQHFQQLLFNSDPDNNICMAFEREITQLWNQSSSEDSYFHFYSIILLSIFPACLASNDEVSVEEKYKLIKNLKMLIARVESMQSSRMVKSNYLLNFTDLIRKMTHLIQLTSIQIETTMVDKVTRECVLDLNRPAILPRRSIGIMTETDELIFSSVFAVINEIGSKVFGEIFEENDNGGEYIATEIAKEFSNCFNFVGASILQIPPTMTDEESSRKFYDLSSRLFKINVSLVHHLWLSQPMILRLPISVIRNIITAIYKKIQNTIFQGFGRREQTLAKETFKLWWICSTSIEDYITILSEIVALSDYLFTIQYKP